jgi:hypothetical protein
MVTAMNDWVTVSEAALLANREKSVIYKWIRSGKLPSQVDPRGVALVLAKHVLRVEAGQKRGRPRGTAAPKGRL